MESAVNEVISWLETWQEASIEVYKKKRKELESIANPIMQKAYSQAGAGAAGDSPGAGGEDGPRVKEIG